MLLAVPPRRSATSFAVRPKGLFRRTLRILSAGSLASIWNRTPAPSALIGEFRRLFRNQTGEHPNGIRPPRQGRMKTDVTFSMVRAFSVTRRFRAPSLTDRGMHSVWILFRHLLIPGSDTHRSANGDPQRVNKPPFETR